MVYYGNPESGNHQSVSTQIDSGGILTKTNNMGGRSGKEIAYPRMFKGNKVPSVCSHIH